MQKSSFFYRLTAAALFSICSAHALAEKNPHLPPPYATPSTSKPSTTIGWAADQTPVAPAGFKVTEFASLAYPRRLYVMPSGDIVVSQAKKAPSDKGENSPNMITIYKMDGTSITGKTFLDNLNLSFGMVATQNEFYVAEAERILKYNYEGDHITSGPVVIASLPFPAPQRHWTRDLALSANGTKLYVSVGSVSNVGESPDPLHPETAAILEMNVDGSERKIFAAGIRNPVTLAFEPTTQQLWACVNERDELGDGLVPDYITHVKEDGFYGWPYSYWGPNKDPRWNGARPDLVAKAIRPDFSVGNHTASLGMTFTTATAIAAPFKQGALISQHGSWNDSVLAGYKVIYVPFKNGQAIDGEKDFLTGFIADEAKGLVYGRPVSSVILSDGTILVADDTGGKIWKVSPEVKPGGLKK